MPLPRPVSARGPSEAEVVAVLALIIGFVLGAEARAILTGTDSRVGMAPAGAISTLGFLAHVRVMRF